jgi:hypothetical protein
MSLCGEGVIAIWNGIVPEGLDNFYEWHNREHMPERVGIPGFRRGRRYIAEWGHPAYFTLYEADTLQTLQGQDYLTRLNHPTEWTKRSVRDFRDVSRAIQKVLWTAGHGMGGYLLTLRFDAADERAEALRRALCMAVLPAIVERTGITGAHLGVTDAATSNVETAEKKARADATLVPNWLIMIEGATREYVEAAAKDSLADSVLTGAGATAKFERGLYRLDYVRTKTAMS